MATYFKGMNYEELSHLTNFMMNSGKVLDLHNIKGFKIDKHSTFTFLIFLSCSKWRGR